MKLQTSGVTCDLQGLVKMVLPSKAEILSMSHSGKDGESQDIYCFTKINKWT